MLPRRGNIQRWGCDPDQNCVLLRLHCSKNLQVVQVAEVFAIVLRHSIISIINIITISCFI